MSATITLAGESLIALKQSQKKPLIIRQFIFAHVPALDPLAPIDRAAGKPPAEQIVHTYRIPSENAGYVNPNQVVYSAQLGSDIGDWDFNWVGLEDEDGILFAVSCVPLQQKRKNIPPLQIGNNVTRNFLVAFDGAQALTEVKIDASTWQHDFTVRLAGIDERERLSNRDLFGRACFFGEAFRLSYSPSAFTLNAGTAYFEGIRVHLAKPFDILTHVPEGQIWLDVCIERDLNDRVVSWSVQFGECQDYTDGAGQRHYGVPIAQVSTFGPIVDLRIVEPISEPVIEHLAARTGDYPLLRARGTTKDDVELGNLPNAKSDDPATNSSEILATTAALNHLNQQINQQFDDSLVGMVASFDMPSAPPGWLKRNGAAVSRTAFAKLFAKIGTRYGAGDGSTTFNLGDSRGRFTRALDDAAGVDPGRVLGSLQHSQNLYHDHPASAAAVGDHVHGAWTDAQGEHGHTAWTDAQGNHQHAQVRAHNSNVGNGSPHLTTANGVNGYAAPTEWAGNHAHNVGIGVAGAHSHNVGIGGAGTHTHAITVHADGGAEARPINEALLVCIKY